VSPLRAVAEARKPLPHHSYIKAIQWIKANPFFRDRVFANPFPRQLSNLHSLAQLRALDDFHELAWHVAYLTTHGKTIAEFVDLRLAFDTAVALGDYAKSKELLNEASVRFGESIWLFKQQISLAQETAGLETQKRVAAAIEREASAFAAFIAHYWSVKCEPSVNSARAEGSFRTLLDSATAETALRDYLGYHVISDSVTLQASIECCRYDALSSAVDLHEAVVSTFRIAAATAISLDHTALATLAFRYASVTRDARIEAAARILGRSGWEVDGNDRRLAAALEGFASNDFVQACQDISVAISEAPTRIDLLDTGSRFEAAGFPLTPSLQRPVDIALRLIGSLRTVADDNAENLGRLQKLAGTWSALEFGRAVRGVTSTVMSSIALVHSQDYRLSTATTSGCSMVLMPSIATHTQTEYLQVLTEAIPQLAPVLFAPAQLPAGLEESQLFTSGDAGVLSTAYLRAAQGTWGDVLACANLLVQSSMRYYSFEGVRLQIRSLLELNKELDAAKALVRLLLSDQRFRPVLPTIAVADAVARRNDPADNAVLCVVVLLDLAAKMAGDVFEGHRNIAYEDFLLLNGHRRPSDLEGHESEYKHDELVYYLRNVCIERIMETSVEFDTSLEVAEERAAVCRLLVKLDPANGEIYDAEHKEILRKLIVRKRSREVEQSKIYVDVESVRATATEKLREQFARYAALAAAKLDDVFFRHLREAIDRLNADLAASGKNLALSLPRNEIDDLFLAMITLVRDEFVSSSEHGLDGYLSTRIRHGTLSGQLRAPLEDAKLITTRDSSGNYKTNERWISAEDGSSEVQRQLGQLLSSFSKSYDALVGEIKSDWVQIRRDASGIGMFAFAISREQMGRIRRQMPVPPSLDVFVDVVLQFLHQELESSLANMRAAICDQGKVRATQMLNELEANVTALVALADTNALITAIRGARTEVQRTFDRVEQWFNVSRSAATEPFLPEDAINIATNMTHVPFDVQIDVSPERQVLCRGERLSLMVDILINLLENVRKHAGLDSPGVNLSVKSDAEAIVFTIVNDVAPGALTSEAALRLTKIRDALADPRHASNVAKEGGSGFHKIWKILSHDFHIRAPQLYFGFVPAADRFEVKVTLPSESIIYEGVSS